MEDILAVVVVLALVVAFTFGLKAIIRGIAEKKAEQKRKQEESDKFWEAERARTKKIAQERTLARMASTNTPPTKKREFVKREETYTPVVQSSSRSLLDDAADIALIANTIHHWNDNSRSEPVREERSVGVSKSESSWGFDDSDSRKSASESLSSSSWSSSDSSSSWSSSSDSGPSSDW
jgi:hypothetical protein